jgi:hypothetical protein
MHRRVFAAVLLVVSLATAVPAIAAPRRGSDPTFVDRIVQKLKKLFNPTLLDYNDPIPPKP